MRLHQEQQQYLYSKVKGNCNLLGEYVRGWNIQSLIFLERNGENYV